MFYFLQGEALPRDVIKQLKDIRRVTAELSVKTVYEVFQISATCMMV